MLYGRFLMRISTGQIYQRGVAAMLEQQTQLSQSQTQLGTGKRVVVPRDDPMASVQILDLQKGIDVSKRFQDNIGSARSTMNMEETSVKNAIDLLQRVRELTIQANNGVLDDQQRRGIAAEVNEHLASMLNIANTQDSNGDYLFAGFSAGAKPFSQTNAGFNYAGDQGQRLLQLGPTRQLAVSDSGADVFQSIRNGNGTFVTSYNNANTGTGIIDPGSVVNAAAWVRDTYSLTFTTPTTYEVRDSSNVLVTSGAYQADAAISFNGIQTAVSGTPAAGDSFTIAPSANQDVFTTLKNLSDALSRGTVDAAAKAQVGNAISRFNRQLVALQAAQQTFMKVQDLTLFNFLK